MPKSGWRLTGWSVGTMDEEVKYWRKITFIPVHGTCPRPTVPWFQYTMIHLNSLEVQVIITMPILIFILIIIIIIIATLVVALSLLSLFLLPQWLHYCYSGPVTWNSHIWNHMLLYINQSPLTYTSVLLAKTFVVKTSYHCSLLQSEWSIKILNIRKIEISTMY